MEGKSFRVLLDVTDLYLENLKYVWVNVSPRELKTIYDFKQCILHKISLEREDISLFVRDGLLLDEETIAVLREDDTVKIKYENPINLNLKNPLKEKANSSQKRNLDESSVNGEDRHSKRHKPEYIDLSSDEGDCNSDQMKSKKKKRKKQTESSLNSENSTSTLIEKTKKGKELTVNSENSHSTVIEKRKKKTESSVNFENSHSTLIEKNHYKKKSHKKKDTNKSSVTIDETVADITFCEDSDIFPPFNSENTAEKLSKNNLSPETVHLDSENLIVLNNGSSSKEKELDQHQNNKPSKDNSGVLTTKSETKKKRKRKRPRKRNPAPINLSDSNDAVDQCETFSGNGDKRINKHILFLSPDRNQESNYFDSDKLQDHPTDTFILKENKTSDIQSEDYPKMSTPAQLNNYSVPDFQLSLMPSKNSNLSNSEIDSVSYDKSTTKNMSPSYVEKEDKSEQLLYEDLPDLTSCPVVGTCIAYKTLELGEDYSPTVSDYKVGVVEKTNPETDEIEIRLNKEIILPGRTGRFENIREDETPEPVIKTCDVLNWCDIISPKLFNCLPE